ncbi:MAG: GNAT family N-acetyltransferase [Planctomycetaceae bacterium]|nr:GNAT family N-acetyltransferase [Planctomycetaceae bacterium]
MNAFLYKLETLDESKIHAVLDSQIREHLRLCFPDSPEKFQSHRIWHNTKPEYTVICRAGSAVSSHSPTASGDAASGDRTFENDTVIGHVAVVIRTITTTWNWRYNVASMQGVSVSPEFRKTGLAVQMLERALDEAKKRGYLYAILFCKEPLVAFYEKQGWRLTDDSVIMRNEQDSPIKMRSNCPMYKALTETPFPEGPVDVHHPEQVGMRANRGANEKNHREDFSKDH